MEWVQRFQISYPGLVNLPGNDCSAPAMSKQALVQRQDCCVEIARGVAKSLCKHVRINPSSATAQRRFSHFGLNLRPLTLIVDLQSMNSRCPIWLTQVVLDLAAALKAFLVPSLLIAVIKELEASCW